MEVNRLKLNANKTELMWVGSTYGLALDLRTGPIRASEHVHLLGVTISPDLGLV